MNRAKSQALSHSNAVDTDALRQKSQPGNKQTSFTAAQPTMSGVPSNDFPMYSGQQALANQSTSQQPGQRQQALTGQVQQQMAQSQPGMSYSQPQGQGQDPQSAALSHHSVRQSQGLSQQNLNSVSADATAGNVMDSNTAGANDEDRNAVLMAALAARAAGAGLDAKREQLRNFSAEQLRQLLAMPNQRNAALNFANNNPNLAMGGVSSAQNMGNWMAQFPNANAGRGAGQVQVGVGQSHALSQALAFEKHKQMQEAHRQQMQPNAQKGLPGQHAKAGVTVPQMTAILEKEKAKIGNSGGARDDKQAQFAEASLQAANRARGSQGMHNGAQVQMRGGAPGVGVTVAAAAAAAAAAGVRAVTTAGVHRPPVPGAGSNNQSTVNTHAGGDAPFWARLDEMKAKHKPTLQPLLPFIRRLQEGQPAGKRESFMRHLRDCLNILSLERAQNIPPKLTIEVLDRAEKFISQVVGIYSQYLKNYAKPANPDPTRRGGQGPGQFDESRSAVSGSQKGVAGQNPTGQQAPRAPARGGGLQNKPGHPIDQSGQGHFDPQQQFIMQHAHLQAQQQKQTMDMMSRAQYQAQQRQQAQPKQQNEQKTPQQQPLQASQVSSPQQGGQQHGGAALSQSSQPRTGQGQGPPRAPGDSSKSVGSGPGGKGTNTRARAGSQRGRATPTMPGSRSNLPVSATLNLAQTQIRPQVGVGPQLQAQMQAQAPAQAQMAGAHGHTQAQLARAQAVQAQATQPHAHVQSQAHAPPQNQSDVQNQRFQQMRAQQAVNRGPKHPVHGMMGQHRSSQGAAPGNAKPTMGVGAGSGWGAKQSGIMTNVGNTGMHAGRVKRPEMTLQQRFHVVDAAVKDALMHAKHVEQYLDNDTKRAKNERIQNTLAALRNNVSMKATLTGKGTKRQASLVDINNFGRKDGVIKSKTVFECSSEDGLRLAKRPKNEAQDLNSLREAVEADCRAARERNPLLIIEIIEEFGQPVVTCLLKIMEIRLPKLVLRVQRGYPRKGGATYGFERPPMGWVGVLDEIRTRFKRALATAPAASVGVAAFLDAWAREADAVINGSHLSENR